MKSILMLLVLMISIASCSTQKQLNKKKHFLEDHGYKVLPKDSFPGECAKTFPCITTEKEVSDSGWIVFGNDNQAVIDSLKKVNDSLFRILQHPPVITDSASCMKAIDYYKAKLLEYGSQVTNLTAQIKNSSVEYRQRTEKLTVESTAKLAAKDVLLKNAADSINRLNLIVTRQNEHIALQDQQLKDYKANEKKLVYILALLWNALMWWLIIAAVLFGLWKFRKALPILKYLPF
jgi:hypothetical protein